MRWMRVFLGTLIRCDVPSTSPVIKKKKRKMYVCVRVYVCMYVCVCMYDKYLTMLSFLPYHSLSPNRYRVVVNLTHSHAHPAIYVILYAVL